MHYDKNGSYKFEYLIPRYSAKIEKSDISTPSAINSITLSFPFGISINFKPSLTESKIAKETILKLIDRRVLKSKECCASCIKDAVFSLKEIKSDLISVKISLAEHINSPLFYFVDYIVLTVNTFIDFTERYDVEQFKDSYFVGLEKLRNHIAQCLYEIARIGNYKIISEDYAFEKGEIGWLKTNYSAKEKYSIDLKV